MGIGDRNGYMRQESGENEGRTGNTRLTKPIPGQDRSENQRRKLAGALEACEDEVEASLKSPSSTSRRSRNKVVNSASIEEGADLLASAAKVGARGLSDCNRFECCAEDGRSSLFEREGVGVGRGNPFFRS
jgi:hypothetical protein